MILRLVNLNVQAQEDAKEFKASESGANMNIHEFPRQAHLRVQLKILVHTHLVDYFIKKK